MNIFSKIHNIRDIIPWKTFKIRQLFNLTRLTSFPRYSLSGFSPLLGAKKSVKTQTGQNVSNQVKRKKVKLDSRKCSGGAGWFITPPIASVERSESSKTSLLENPTRVSTEKIPTYNTHTHSRTASHTNYRSRCGKVDDLGKREIPVKIALTRRVKRYVNVLGEPWAKSRLFLFRYKIVYRGKFTNRRFSGFYSLV